MDPRLLQTFMVDIVQKLDLPAIVPHLVEAQLLTRHDQEELTNKHHSQDIRIMKWVDKLVKKGSDGVLKFVDCLKRCPKAGGHEELIKKIGVAGLADIQQAMTVASAASPCPMRDEAMITGMCTSEVQHQSLMLNLPQSCSGAQFPMVTSGQNHPASESSSINIMQSTAVSRHVQLINITELRTNYLSLLIGHLDIIAIAPHLATAGLLPRHEREHLLNEHISSQERIMKLVENLSRGGQDSVPKFLDCLRQTINVPGHSILLGLMQYGTAHHDGSKSIMVAALDPNCFQSQYTKLITDIKNMARRASSDELLNIAALFLPDEHLRSLHSGYGPGSLLTIQSLEHHLAQIHVCNPIDIDTLIVILTELNMCSLTESIMDYACNIQNASIHNFQLSNDDIPGPLRGFFYLHISHQINPITACDVWDLKQNMSLMLMNHSSYRGQFWFRGISNSVESMTVVWQFLSAHEEQILGKLTNLHGVVNMIQYQNSSGHVSTRYDSQSLTHNQRQSLGIST